MKEISEMERQLAEEAESLVLIEKAESEVRPIYLWSDNITASVSLSLGW